MPPFLRWLAVPLVVLPASVRADEPGFAKTTHTYKTVGGHAILADVYRPADDKVRPVVVWLHGGALIVGNRTGIPKPILDLCRKEGYALVSFDYRLAPEVKAPDIVADVEDAFRWLREKGPALHIDPTRLVVTGGSAGGYLTLTVGARVKPRPTALVAYWGYGDIDTDWLTKPSEHYRTKVPLVPKDEAYGAVSKGVVSSPDGDAGKARGRFYLYTRQNGLWVREVTGLDPAKDREALDKLCPVKHVTADYPPTMLIHGTEDTDVPYEKSVDMAKQFERFKVPYEFVTVKGAGHGLSGGDKAAVADANDRAVAFIKKQLSK